MTRGRRRRRIFPDHAADTFAWGLICTFGALFYAQTDAARIRAILGIADPGADGEAVARLVTRYIVGGMRNLAAEAR